MLIFKISSAQIATPIQLNLLMSVSLGQHQFQRYNTNMAGYAELQLHSNGTFSSATLVNEFGKHEFKSGTYIVKDGLITLYEDNGTIHTYVLRVLDNNIVKLTAGQRESYYNTSLLAK